MLRQVQVDLDRYILNCPNLQGFYVYPQLNPDCGYWVSAVEKSIVEANGEFPGRPELFMLIETGADCPSSSKRWMKLSEPKGRQK